MPASQVALRVAIYCPDDHLTYDLALLDEVGVGGGVTTRVRMAHALAGLGHRVTLFVNSPREQHLGGVEYKHHTGLRSLETDIFIASTSGAQDLSALCDRSVRAGLRLLLIHGPARPQGAECLPFDCVYAPSEFIRSRVEAEWGGDLPATFTTHRGVAPADDESTRPDRELYSLVYSSHPSKGLQAAIGVAALLRETEPRFALHVYGDEQLWGRKPSPPAQAAGIVYHGLVGQRALNQQLPAYMFSLNLQTRAEPYGIVINEAMRAGCIVLASPVGAYPEIIRHGLNGFLVSGDPAQPETLRRAASLIVRLIRNADYAAYIRRNAIASPHSWDAVARTWTGHWHWWLSGKPASWLLGHACHSCGGDVLPLADGLHCVACGRYQRHLAA